MVSIKEAFTDRNGHLCPLSKPEQVFAWVPTEMAIFPKGAYSKLAVSLGRKLYGHWAVLLRIDWEGVAPQKQQWLLGLQTPGVTGKFGLGVQNEEGQRLIEFCQENALVLANNLFQQHKRRLYTWTSPDGQYWNQIDYILCSKRWRSSIQSAKTRPGADCGSDHELLIAKFRLKLKKVGKTTRPFRYDLNQNLQLYSGIEK